MELISDLHMTSFGETMRVETELQKLRGRQEIGTWNSVKEKENLLEVWFSFKNL